MLVRKDGSCIGQASHAWISGQLARAWAAPPLPEAVILAAEQHDIGMAEWDLDPTINPETQRPHAFTEMDLDTHLRLWTAAPRKLLMQSAHAAVLVSLHGSYLYRRRAEENQAVRDYLDGQARFRAPLIAALQLDAAELTVHQQLIAAFDALSLALLLDWAPYTAGGIELTQTGATAFTLTPWPLAVNALTLTCDSWRDGAPSAVAIELAIQPG